MSKDIQYIKKTFELALKAKGRTSPNPMVGALVVKNGKILSEGYHRQAGTVHAEVVALNKLKNYRPMSLKSSRGF